jgi:hypothetical protein
MNKAETGNVLFTKADVRARKDFRNGQPSVVTIRGKVYDLSAYLSIAVDAATLTPRPESSMFPEDFTAQLTLSQGQDASDRLANQANIDDYLKCMELLFAAGLATESPEALSSCSMNPILIGLSLAVLLPMLMKLVLACVVPFLGLAGAPAYPTSASVLYLVYAKDESPVEMQKCIESIVDSHHPMERKFIFVIVDGEIMTEDSYTNRQQQSYRNMLSVLQYKDGDSNPHQYTSLSQRTETIANMAKVFSGRYCTPNGDFIPYILVSKTGSELEYEDERTVPGARGKRDSLFLLLRTIRALVNRESKLSPLEYEIYQHFVGKLMVDPGRFDYCISMDARSRLDPPAIEKLVNHLDTHPNQVMAGSQIRPTSYLSSFSSVMLSWPFYYGWDMHLRLEGLLGSSIHAFPPYASVLYRLRQVEGGEICILDQELLETFSNNCQVPTTMHDHQQMITGADRYIGTSLFIPYGLNGVKGDYVPKAATFRTLSDISFLGVAIQDFNGTFHLEWRLVREARSGFTQIYAFIRCFWMFCKPVVLLYWYYCLIYGIWLLTQLPKGSITISTLLSNNYLLVGSAVVVIIFLQFVMLFVRLKFALMISSLFYLLFGLPFYEILIPFIAIWCWDYPVAAYRLNSAVGKAQFVPYFSIAEWQNGVAEKRMYQNPAEPAPAMLEEQWIASKPASRKNSQPNILDNDTPGEVNASRLDPWNRVSTVQPLSRTSVVLDDQNTTSPAYSRVNTMRPDSLMPSWEYRSSQLPSPRKSKAATSSQYFQPTNFGEQPRPPPAARGTVRQSTDSADMAWRKSGALSRKSAAMTLNPNRAVSMARSDYSLSTVDGQRMSMRSLAPSTTSVYMDRMSMTDEQLAEMTGGVTKEEIKEEIRFVLDDADLNTVTRREVKEHLYLQFGDAVDVYGEFINSCIEEYTLEKLALI